MISCHLDGGGDFEILSLASEAPLEGRTESSRRFYKLSSLRCFRVRSSATTGTSVAKRWWHAGGLVTSSAQRNGRIGIRQPRTFTI
jgi:hypothetical protein